MTMTPLLKKLNFKQQKEIIILNHPVEFKEELKAIELYTTVKTNLNNINEIEFALIFLKTLNKVNTILPLVNEKLKGDAIIWCAYAKKNFKKLSV
ncbi:hypothetical protein ACFQ5N_14110 [Lutibacter holmesii]|uniref:Uncharacterized protein n=1 Tax=Lutibacter holmesii TaxID=1137985 RepID=A0ABW3WRG5_9FLAO